MNRITAGAIALVLAILLAGCAQHRLAAQCRWVDADDFVRYGCGTMRKPGEYIVTLGDKTDVNILNELYGQFGIKRIEKLKEMPRQPIKSLFFSDDGKIQARLFLVVLTDDPGHQKMFELGDKATQLFGPTYVLVTPNGSVR